jgi:hypothetical protein
MKALLLLSVLISLSSPALARIGETREQCEARYGKPVEVWKDGSTTVHEKSGLRVKCHYYEGICDHLMFSNLAKDAEGRRLPVTETEFKTLLEANSSGQPWKKGVEDPATHNTLWSSGNDLSAMHNTGPEAFLSISTKASLERTRAKHAADKESRLKGF